MTCASMETGEPGSRKWRERNLGEHANEAIRWLLQQQTQFASKLPRWKSVQSIFQAFSISVLHFCGLESSQRVSCTVFHLSEVFVFEVW